VSEHSFRAPFCWCNSARAQGLQKTNMPSIERSVYLLNTHTICAIFLCSWTQCIDNFSISLPSYVSDAENPAILILLPRAHNPSDLQQGSRARAGRTRFSEHAQCVRFRYSQPIRFARFDRKSVNHGNIIVIIWFHQFTVESRFLEPSIFRTSR